MNLSKAFIIILFVALFSIFLTIGSQIVRATNDNILPPAASYNDSIDNLPKWERIIEFYNMANLSNPSPEYREWWNFIRSIKNDTPVDQITKTNKWLNKFTYKQDNWIYNRADHWATPSEFLKNGGDCEDFAIIKYMTLRRLGFRTDQMKIAMVYDIYSGTDHSYLVVTFGNRTFVLDSREQSTNPQLFKKRYQAHYAFNEKGIWRYKSPRIVLKSRQNKEVLPSNR